LELIYTVTDFPFFMDIADSDLDANHKIEPLLNHLEQILDCLIIYEVAPKEASNHEEETKNADSSKKELKLHKSISNLDP